MTATRPTPVKFQKYTIAEIVAFGLDASLLFRVNGFSESVQTSHLRDEELAAIGGDFANLRWQFSRTNYEWISEFYLVQDTAPNGIIECLDVHVGHYGATLYVPKGTLKRAQITWPVAS